MIELLNDLQGCQIKEELLSKWKEKFAPGVLGRQDYKFLKDIVR